MGRFRNLTLHIMRNRIVVWGRNAQEERVLIAVELLVERNVVKIETFTEKDVSDEVFKNFMEKWRKNEDTELPEPKKVWARELSVSEGLLPDELKVEQSDMINRAQTEWHYLVLSAKLKEAYRAELAEISDRVERADKYDSNVWGQLKSFWEKIQGQLKDKTLLNEHGTEIRAEVDKVFDAMKKLRDQLTDELKEKSAAAITEFANKLESIEKQIEEGTHLRRAFDELRKIQSAFHNAAFSRDDRKLVYDRIDAAFKKVKGKRGDDNQAASSGAMARLTARLTGLEKAMEKMERSIGMDVKDLEFENRRIANASGQLENQIRQAKIKMIESRRDSKQEKLDDMQKTQQMLEANIAKEKTREEKRAKQAAEKTAAEAVKAKIAAEMKAEKAELSDEEKAKLAAAAAAIAEAKKQKKAVPQPKEEAPETPTEKPTEASPTEEVLPVAEAPTPPPTAGAAEGAAEATPAKEEDAPQEDTSAADSLISNLAAISEITASEKGE